VASAGPERVIVIGAGPTGLTLTSELALAGVECVLLDQRTGPRDESRASCVHARSMEMLDLRGLAETFARTGLPMPSLPLGLKGAVIGFGRLDSDFPYLLDIPQNEVEALLADLTLDGLPMDDTYGDLTRRGLLLVYPMRGGTCKAVVYDYSRAEVPVTEPVSFAEVTASMARITGRDFGPRDMSRSDRYRSHSRQAPRYRAGLLPCWSGRTGTWPGRPMNAIRRSAISRRAGRWRTGAARADDGKAVGACG